MCCGAELYSICNEFSTVHYTYYYPRVLLLDLVRFKPLKSRRALNRAGMLGGRAGRAEGFDTLRPLSSPIHFVQSPEYLTTSPTSRRFGRTKSVGTIVGPARQAG